MTPRPPLHDDLPPQCKKGTFNGAAAEASAYTFARCILPAGHQPPCDSGPDPDPNDAKVAA